MRADAHHQDQPPVRARLRRPEQFRARYGPCAVVTGGTSGLGLALVAKIVGEHGGIVECESTSRGTTFRILMPAWKEMSAPHEDDSQGDR